jgi:hypothetical protein
VQNVLVGAYVGLKRVVEVDFGQDIERTLLGGDFLTQHGSR